VWDFARGCMRTCLILADKARRFGDDQEIADALPRAKAAEASQATLGDGTPASRTPEAIDGLRRRAYHLDALAAYGYGHERLDQLMTERLLGTH